MRPLLAALVLAVPAAAAELPLAGERLLLRDGPAPETRRVRLRAADPGMNPAAGVDPRVAGATLEIAGDGPGDGATGTILLEAAGWKGLGAPPGSRGWKFADRRRETGVRRVVLQSRAAGGMLAVQGGGAAWPYAVSQPQGPIDVRLAVGDDRYCARFTTYLRNEAGRLDARGAPPPARCAPCGNGVLDPGEECDDADGADGDGCSADCRVELCAGVTPVAGTALATELVAEGLEAPVHVTAPRIDTRRLFIVEQPGRVRVVRDGVLQTVSFLAIETRVSCCGERGLLSIAFHPDYHANGRFFASYTDSGGDTVVSAWRVSADPDRADLASEQVLFTLQQPQPNHNGGQIAFGADGRLWIGMGDGGGSGDPLEAAQDDGTLLGKLLRLDVDTPGAVPEVWAKGLRNPWRFSFDRATGDLYLADVGQDTIEEVNAVPWPLAPGLNFGWDIFEGSQCFEPEPPATECPSPPVGFTMPVTEYGHGEGCSVTGGFVYRGCRLPDLHGTYFYSDACSGFVRSFRGVEGGRALEPGDHTAALAPGGGRSLAYVTSFGEDARGEVYVVDYGEGGSTGEVYRIVPAS